MVLDQEIISIEKNMVGYIEIALIQNLKNQKFLLQLHLSEFALPQ